MVKSKEKQPSVKLQWHPAFCAAAELELRFNKADLEFKREYNLSKKPLQMDLLIIEKRKNVQIQNEIGAIFRGHNVIEYKSPDDGMTIDDFFKTLGYAYLYKGLGEKVDQIPLEELTVSLFRASAPKQLFKQLIGYGYKVEQHMPGIYYVKGFPIPIQIVVTKELDSKNHESLKVLSRSAEKEDIQKFTELARDFSEPGDKEKADAVLQVSVAANREKYDEVRRSENMCEALRELMKEEIEQELEKARKEGLRLGKEEGKQVGEQQGRETGRAQGLEEGRAEGRAEGRVEGHSEGETQAKKEMAYELYHEEGFSVERIAKLVKLDRETVEKWLKEKTTA
jgi:flagellar biosynthesis/type III secretory pathway protein FliH